MKFLLVDAYIHHKNKLSIQHMARVANARLVVSANPNHFTDAYDLVFVPSTCIPASAFPRARRIVYGPHNFVFIQEPWISSSRLFDGRCVYTMLSQWVGDMEAAIAPMCLPSKPLPFSVDIDLFRPDASIPKEYDCFVYVKQRRPDIVRAVLDQLNARQVRYTIVTYGSYKEDDYIRIARASKFGVWVGRHESQGYALEEALSIDCPLIVLDATTMFDEYDNGRETYAHLRGRLELKSTSIPYWSDECGIRIEQLVDLPAALDTIVSRTFSPRKYIVETLSHEKCLSRFLGIPLP
jgi:hypothetical protein